MHRKRQTSLYCYLIFTVFALLCGVFEEDARVITARPSLRISADPGEVGQVRLRRGPAVHLPYSSAFNPDTLSNHKQASARKS